MKALHISLSAIFAHDPLMDGNSLQLKPESVLQARLVQESFNYTLSETATTVASSTARRQDIEADDASSVSRYTYTSDDAGQFRREVDGRVS